MSYYIGTEEYEEIAEMLRQGMPIHKISGLTGRSSNTIQKIKKELGLTGQKKSTDELAETADMDKYRWLQKNWPPKLPEKPKKTEPKKRDWWTKETGSHFRTPYHFPGKPH